MTEQLNCTELSFFIDEENQSTIVRYLLKTYGISSFTLALLNSYSVFSFGKRKKKHFIAI